MYILEIIGIISFAISGAMVGIDRKADAFGVLLLAIITALGGGVIRDILLGHFPPRMFTSSTYLALAIVCALAVFTVALVKKEKYQLLVFWFKKLIVY